MGREIKRVPMSFGWPLNQVWKGFVNPYAHLQKDCDACGASGYAQPARVFLSEWYGYLPFSPASMGSDAFTTDHPIIAALATRNEKVVQERHAEAVRLCRVFNARWQHHLSQKDVEALVKKNRLWDFTRLPRTEEQKAAYAESRKAGGNYWMPKNNGYMPTAREVNEWSLAGFGHDGFNMGICVAARCKRNGLPVQCSLCEGNGSTWPRAEDKAAYESWKPVEPPTGKGWQLWETVSDGSPISPVCNSPESLAAWLVENKATVGADVPTYDQWMAFIKKGWAPTGVSDSVHGYRSGVVAASDS